MDTTQAKRLVLLATGAAGTTAALGSMYRGQFPSARIIIGAISAGVMLSALAEFQPGLAAGFAATIAVTAVFVVGGDAFAGISRTLPTRNLATAAAAAGATK